MERGGHFATVSYPPSWPRQTNMDTQMQVLTMEVREEMLSSNLPESSGFSDNNFGAARAVGARNHRIMLNVTQIQNVGAIQISDLTY